MAVFVRVVETGGFSAAARSFGMTPSAASKLVGRLEERLGARLLRRTTRRLSLTEEGRAFHLRAVRILADIEEAEQAVTALRTAPRGLLRVDSAIAFAHHQLARVLSGFLERYPEVRVELNGNDRFVDLAEEGIDVAIRTGRPPDSSYIARKLADDQRLIFAAPSYLGRYGTPATPTDLNGHNCLTWTHEHDHLNEWPFLGPDGPVTVRASGNTEVNNGETLYNLAVAGVGIARLAVFRVDEDIRANRLVPLLVEHHRPEPMPIHAVYPHRRHLSPKVRAFVDYLVEAFAGPPWMAALADYGLPALPTPAVSGSSPSARGSSTTSVSSR